MSSNLNIKYGQKTREVTNESTQETEIVSNLPVSPVAGTIYVAENDLDELEIYVDKPVEGSGLSERFRVDSKVYIGPSTSNGSTLHTNQEVFDNYDVWIDTTGDEIGTATSSSAGLMSATQAYQLATLIDQLSELKIRIAKGPWRAALETDSTDTLTVLMPQDWSGTDFIWSPGQGL